jgi:signal transduction histidine kinase
MGVRGCDLPYIFEKGFTGKSGEDGKKATGMGLYLAKEIAKDLKVSMEAVSQWGKGFEMRIVFPVVESSFNDVLELQ